MSRNSSVSTVPRLVGDPDPLRGLGEHVARGRGSRAARSSSRSGSPARRRSASSKPASRTAGPRRPASAVGERQQLPVHLDRRAVAQVADPQVAQAAAGEQAAYGGLGALDPGQPVRGDLDAVRHPAGEAGGGRLVPGRQPPAAGGLADLGLGQPGVAQRRDRAALVGGADARAGSRRPRRRRWCRSRRWRCRAPRPAG